MHLSFSPHRAGRLLATLGVLVGVGAGPLRAAVVELFDNPVLARGRGFEIRQNELDDAFTALKATLVTQGQAIPREEEAAFKARMLDRMILTRILLLRASDEDRARARELADQFIADTKRKAPSEESYRRQLLASGMKPEVFETRAYEQAVVEKVLERELKSTLTVPEAEVRAFYEQGEDVNTRELAATLAKLEAAGHQDTVFYRDGTNRLAFMKRANLQRLMRPEQVTADLILLYTIDPLSRAPLAAEAERERYVLATNTLARLRGGEDFARVAREVSEDPDVQRTGGQYVATRATPMAPELLDALFTMPLNEFHGPIITRFGLYLARVRERLPAVKLPFEQVQDDIRDLLLAQMVEKRLPAYAEQLRKEYEVVLPGTETEKR